MIKCIQVLVLLMITHSIWCDECDNLPDFKEIPKCCKLPLLVEVDLHDACTKELNVKTSADYDVAIECKMSECLFKKGDAIVDGKPSTAEIKKYVKKLLAEYPGWETVFYAAVDKCVPLVIEQDAETKKRASEPPFNMDKTVNPMYAHLFACIGTELVLECPEKARGDGPKCDAIKADLKKCAKEFPPRYLATPSIK